MFRVTAEAEGEGLNPVKLVSAASCNRGNLLMRLTRRVFVAYFSIFVCVPLSLLSLRAGHRFRIYSFLIMPICLLWVLHTECLSVH